MSKYIEGRPCPHCGIDEAVLNNKIECLEEQAKKDNEELVELRDEVDTDSCYDCSTVDDLKSKIDDLEYECDDLQDKYDNLKRMYDEVLSDYGTLEKTFNLLEDDYNELRNSKHD